MRTFIIIVLFTLFSQNLANLHKPLDLTWHFDNKTLYWKGTQPFKFTKQVINTEPSFYAMNEFSAGEHGGTHLDAPYHFNKNGIKVGDIPLKSLIVPGILVDISEEVKKGGPSTNLRAYHLRKWVKTYGEIPKNSVILVKFGWAKYWPNKDKYFNIQEDGGYYFPGISKDAAQWIVDTKKVVGVGVDVASVDPGLSNTLDAHVIMHGHGLYHLENVNIKDDLPAKGFTLFVMPMKIRDGTGAPLRVVATPPVDFI